jgi:hypothetical protein
LSRKDRHSSGVTVVGVSGIASPLGGIEVTTFNVDILPIRHGRPVIQINHLQNALRLRKSLDW